MKEEKIKVLALLPMELPKEIELDNTLEAMQKFVGGLIECITLSDTGSEVTLVCNDEGKLLGLPLNRPLWDGADVLAGPGFLAGCDNEGNMTLSPSRKNGQEKCEKSRMKQTGANESKVKRQKLHTAAFQNRRAISIQSKSEDELCCRKLQYKQRYRSVPPAWSGSGADEPAHISDS